MLAEHASLDRLLRIMVALGGNRSYSLKEICDKFEINERTAYRYIGTLRDAGFIVERENGRYKIPGVNRNFKGIDELLHFSEEEAYILTQAIHSIDDTNLLKMNLIKKLYSLYDFKRVADTVIKPENGSTVHSIIEAIENKKQLLLRSYSSAHGKIVRDRLVEPFDFTSNYISFWAFEPESMQSKLFKTARVKKTEILESNQKFTTLQNKKPVDVFRISSADQFPVKLLLNIRAYNLLIEEYPLANKYITQIDDNLWQFEANVCSYEGVGRFVLGLFDEVEIVESEEFRDFIRRKIIKYSQF